MAEKKLRIIKIIDNTTLVGIGGEDNGLVVGQRFNVIGKTDGEEIKDPESGETLGFLGKHKGTVVAQDVHEKFTVYKSEFIEEKKRQLSASEQALVKNFSQMSGILKTISPITAEGLSTTPAHYEKLNVDLDQLSSSTATDVIKIGDYLEPVKSVNYNDED